MHGDKVVAALLSGVGLVFCLILLAISVVVMGFSGPVVSGLLLTLGIIIGMVLTFFSSATLKYVQRSSESGADAVRKKKDAERELKRILDERNRVWAEIEAKKQEKDK